jgi:phage terminase small subunit
MRELTPKQRAFAMHVVAGVPKAQAYRMAYSSSAADSTARSEGYKLCKRPQVAAYLEQLKAEAGKALLEHVANDLALDRKYVLGNLKEVVERCMERELVLDRNGKPVTVITKTGELAAVYTFDSKGANRALELIGKEFGMFVERKEVRHGALAEASDEELDAELGRLASELARVTGKPIKQILLDSMRGDLAIDVTQPEHSDRSLALVEQVATEAPGGES